jgi:methylphosphotriester-DNA--protein-cysteine methyltransferase
MAFPGSKRRNGLGTDESDAATPFVANRNSELSHHRECKSVKRINAENITAFNSMEQAMLEGFKPCRACCDSMTIKKAAAGGLGFRRMQAV